MWNLLGKKDSRTPIKLSTIKEGLCQKIARKLLCLKSGFSAVGVRVERADGFFDVLIDIRVVCIFCI